MLIHARIPSYWKNCIMHGLQRIEAVKIEHPKSRIKFLKWNIRAEYPFLLSLSICLLLYNPYTVSIADVQRTNKYEQKALFTSHVYIQIYTYSNILHFYLIVAIEMKRNGHKT